MGAGNIIKYLFFAFNLVFFISGSIILALSVHAVNNKLGYRITDYVLPAVTLLIFMSAVTLIFGFLGCCGAMRDNHCLLAVFFVGLFLMFLIILAVGTLGVLSRTPTAQEVVKEGLQQLLPLSEQPKEIQESYQNVEREGSCCGVFGGHVDWGNSSMVPNSCNCTDPSRNCSVLDSHDYEVYSTPCVVYIMTWLDRVSDTIMGITLAFSILLILGMIFSLFLLCQLKRNSSII